MKKYLIAVLIAVVSIPTAFAGNADRAGEAGAYELVINGWARSSGVFGMNTANVKGLESMRSNVAGLALTKGTEVLASYSFWLQGSETSISQAGLAQQFGDGNVVGISIMSMGFGEITRTTVDNPEGGLGTFKPSFLNIGIGYSRAFSNSIYGGMTFRLVNERIEDLNATGFALDAGIQYVTGPRDNIHFGVSIRNIGTPLKYAGDGFSFRGESPTGDFNQSLLQKSAQFQLPSLLNIGMAYDIYAGEALDEDCYPDHRITIMGNFTSNSVGKDHAGLGLEYGFREMFMARVGYRYESNIFSSAESTTVHTGLSAGVSMEVPFGKDGTGFGIDYSYRPSRVWKGTHTIGARFTLGGDAGKGCNKGFKKKSSDSEDDEDSEG